MGFYPPGSDTYPSWPRCQIRGARVALGPGGFHWTGRGLTVGFPSAGSRDFGILTPGWLGFGLWESTRLAYAVLWLCGVRHLVYSVVFA